jgi:hypothetical protein
MKIPLTLLATCLCLSAADIVTSTITITCMDTDGKRVENVIELTPAQVAAWNWKVTTMNLGAVTDTTNGPVTNFSATTFPDFQKLVVAGRMNEMLREANENRVSLIARKSALLISQTKEKLVESETAVKAAEAALNSVTIEAVTSPVTIK